MPAKIARSSPRPSFGLPKLLVVSRLGFPGTPQNRYYPRWSRRQPRVSVNRARPSGYAAGRACLVNHEQSRGCSSPRAVMRATLSVIDGLAFASMRQPAT
jgi:hypothetical protein